MKGISLFLLSLSLSLYACSDKKEKGAPAAKETPEKSVTEDVTPTAAAAAAALKAASCKEQAAGLKSFLTQVFDSNAQVAAPWPSRDPEVDAWIEESRAKLREMMKPADPSAPQKQLVEGVDTSVEDEMYRDCPEGLAALRAVAKAAPDKRIEAMVAIADGVEACDCKVKIAQVKASAYLGQRGPD